MVEGFPAEGLGLTIGFGVRLQDLGWLKIRV